MVQFVNKFFFLGFLQFLLGFLKVPVFLCHSVYYHTVIKYYILVHIKTTCFVYNSVIIRPIQNI